MGFQVCTVQCSAVTFAFFVSSNDIIVPCPALFVSQYHYHYTPQCCLQFVDPDIYDAFDLMQLCDCQSAIFMKMLSRCSHWLFVLAILFPSAIRGSTFINVNITRKQSICWLS